jgi:hypothetical protein
MSTLIENISTPSNSGERLREEGYDVSGEEDHGQGDPSSHSPRASPSGPCSGTHYSPTTDEVAGTLSFLSRSPFTDSSNQVLPAPTLTKDQFQ